MANNNNDVRESEESRLFSPEEVKIAKATFLGNGRAAVIKDSEEGIGYVLTRRECGNYGFGWTYPMIPSKSGTYLD